MTINHANTYAVIKHEVAENLTAIRVAAQLMCRQSEGRQTYPIAKNIVKMTEQVSTTIYQLQHTWMSDNENTLLNMIILGDESRLPQSLKDTLYQMAQMVIQQADIQSEILAKIHIKDTTATIELYQKQHHFFSYTVHLNH